ncbi:MAG: hypothetical protein K9N34_02330 [Candidatus Marinimicrobia bacterium]|nr:hypothetical protein [Candidatus Neomarinimicrobiota bacterium]MCF7840834.1 hypothetical protein [Candidatus Neomarinimicrobiota bacterium]MCF7901825.1 hypothetical protein [Candidatus Neomarinimicrobiota bacterium]
MLKAATIDIGSNSVKYLYIEYDANGIYAKGERVEVTRLSEGLSQNGVLSSTAMQRTQRRVMQMVRELKSKHVRRIFIVGTMALRTAKNASEFLTRMRDARLPEVTILDGDEEARLGQVAVIGALHRQLGNHRYCIFDTGGGSTEFIVGEQQDVNERKSLDLGVVDCTEKYLGRELPNRSSIMACEREIEQTLDGIPVQNVDVLVGVGGTVTTLAATHLGIEPYDPGKIHGTTLTRADIQNLREQFLSLPLEARKNIPGLHPQRADVIIAGVLIVQSIMKKLRCKELVVSDAGLRLGVMIDRLGLTGRTFQYIGE